MKARLACLMFVALAGCEGSRTLSRYVKTSGFFVTFIVEQRESSSPRALARVNVSKATGQTLDLVDGDALACDGLTLVAGTDLDGMADYEATLNEAPSHLFELTRPDDVSASATVPMPPSLQLTSGPLDGGADSQYSITWVKPAATDGTRISVVARSSSPGCQPVTLSADGADTGSFAFDGSSFGRTVDGGSPHCEYVIDVSRQTIASLGGAFAGGERRSRVIRTVELHVH